MARITYAEAYDAAQRVCNRAKRFSNYFKATCPAHGSEKGLSLVVYENPDGTANFTCQSLNCSPIAIIKALGLWTDYPAATTPKSELTKRVDPLLEVDRYEVNSKHGKLVKIRKQDSEGNKEFQWVRNGGFGLNGLKPRDIPLFNYEDIGGGVVIFTEGEKAAKALKAQGYTAVSGMGGANVVPSDEVLSALLVASTVVLWPDKDIAGENFMDSIGQALLRLEHPSVMRLSWPGAQPSDDAHDAIEAQVNIDELITSAKKVRRKRNTDPVAAKWVPVSTFTRENIDFLSKPYLVRGAVNILKGDPATLKSHVGASITAAATTGGTARGSFPEWNPNQKGKVVFINSEDGVGNTTLPRLEHMGADTTQVITLSKESAADFMLGGKGWDEFENMLDEIRPLAVIIDPYFDYLDTDINPDSSQQVRPSLRLLGQLAAEYNVAIILVVHNTKNTNVKSGYRTPHSVAFQAKARSVLLFGYCEKTDEYAMVHDKSSGAELAPAWTHGYVDGVYQWIGLSTLTASDLDNPEKDNKTKLDLAVEFLKEQLADGEKPTSEINALAKQQDPKLSERTIERARPIAGVESYKVGSINYLQLRTTPPNIPQENVGGVVVESLVDEEGTIWTYL